MGDLRIDGTRRREWTESTASPATPTRAEGESRAAAKRTDAFVQTSTYGADAAAAAAWNTVANAPMPTAGKAPAPGCAPAIPLATADNAKTLADGGVPLGIALQHSLIATASELERFIDEYVAYTDARPEMRALHDDALRMGPEIFARRLDLDAAQRAAEHERLAREQRMTDRVAPLQVRPPLPIQQRAAVGEVAIPIAQTVDEIAKLVPIAGELLLAVEAITGKTIGGLGYDIELSERVVSGALALAPFALEGLVQGVRGAAQLVRLARATGKTTDETRRLLVAARTIEANSDALREGLAAKKAGRPLTAAQAEAFRTADGALAQIRGAAAQSIFDVRGGTSLPVRTFANNPNGAVRSLTEATAIAERHGVKLPSWIRIEVDDTVREAANFAEYTLIKEQVPGTKMFTWTRLAPEGQVTVRIHPSVLKSDEKIVAVLQHEVWELSQLRVRVDAKGMLPAEEVARLIQSTSGMNLHGQAWDIADLRVLIMRETDPAKKIALTKRLEQRMEIYAKRNLK